MLFQGKHKHLVKQMVQEALYYLSHFLLLASTIKNGIQLNYKLFKGQILVQRNWKFEIETRCGVKSEEGEERRC